MSVIETRRKRMFPVLGAAPIQAALAR